MADEKSNGYDWKNLYFTTFESRDAELVLLRDKGYEGDHARMLAEYQSRLKTPQANVTHLQDDIARLQAITEVEYDLKCLTNDGHLLKGTPATSSRLVAIFEKERKKKNGGQGLLAMLL